MTMLMMPMSQCRVFRGASAPEHKIIIIISLLIYHYVIITNDPLLGISYSGGASSAPDILASASRLPLLHPSQDFQ